MFDCNNLEDIKNESLKKLLNLRCNRISLKDKIKERNNLFSQKNYLILLILFFIFIYFLFRKHIFIKKKS